MYLEFVTHTDGTPIPHVGGRIHYPLARFLIYLRNTYKKKGGCREPQTIINIYNHMKILFDYCADVQLRFDELTFDPYVTLLKKALLQREVKPQSLNLYYRTWRSFYEWCDLEGVPHIMVFPTKILKNVPAGSSASFWKSSNLIAADPGLESVEIVVDYKDCILNAVDYSALASELRKIDPVFEMIAFVMLTTGLRIGGVLQMPLGPDAKNKNWLRYPELLHRKAVFQKMNYIPKGGKRLLSCIVLTEALKVVYEQYIRSFHKGRGEIYLKKNESKDIAPLWLNAKGKVIFSHDIWLAFRKASEVLGRRIVPHFLRHTYATYIIYNYFKAHSLKPNLAYAHDIHEQLRQQLGHSDLEVTKKYIKTIMRVEMEAWLPVLTPGVDQLINLSTPVEVMRNVKDFFESANS